MYKIKFFFYANYFCLKQSLIKHESVIISVLKLLKTDSHLLLLQVKMLLHEWVFTLRFVYFSDLP